MPGMKGQQQEALKEDIVRLVYGHSAQCSFGFGLLFNTFLAWLIIKRTPAPMRVYSKLLIGPVIMDFLLAVSTYLVQPIPVVAHGYFAIMQNGIFRNAPTLINYSANVFWLQLLLVFVCCTTIQFIFRYYMIISDGRIPTKLKWLTSAVLIVLLTAHVVFHYLSDFPYAVYHPEMRELARKVYREVGLTDIRFASFTPGRSILWLLHCAAMLGVFIVCYWIIIHCAIGTRHYILMNYEACCMQSKNSADARKNIKMREYNNQLTQALIIQAILPTLDVLELSVQTTLPIYLPNHGTNYFLIFAAVPLYFIPILNPLATMFLFKPYRRAVFKILKLPKIFGQPDATSKTTIMAHVTPHPVMAQQSTETTQPQQQQLAMGEEEHERKPSSTLTIPVKFLLLDPTLTIDGTIEERNNNNYNYAVST